MTLRLGLASDMHHELSRYDDFKRLEAITGPLQARRSYDSGDIPDSFTTSAASIDPLLKVASCWSCKPVMHDLGSGALDDRWTAFVTSVPAKHRLWATTWHEPEDDIAAGHYSLADWTAGIIRAANLTKSFGRGRVHFGVCLMDWTFNPKSGRNPEDYRAACEAVDFVAVDAYGQSLDAFTAWAATLENKPRLAVWECSTFTNDPQNLAAYITATGTYCNSHGYQHLIAYNSDYGNSRAVIDGDPASAAAFTNLVTQYAPK